MKWIIIVSISLLMVSGCSSTLPDIPIKAYDNVKSCSDTTLSHKAWEQKQKLTYIKNHTGKELFSDIEVDRYGNSYRLHADINWVTRRMVKYNCHGQKVWQISIPKKENITIKALAIQGDYLYMIGRGQVLNPPLKNGSRDVTSYRYIAKYDLDGKRLWLSEESKRNNIENANTFQVDFAVNTKGEVYVMGMQTTKERSYIDKYSPSGRFLWCKTFPDLEFYKITIDKKENLILTGFMERNALIAKYDAEGKLLWKQLYEYENNHQVMAFFESVVDNNNHIYTTGNNRRSHAYIFKFDPYGKRLWAKKTEIVSQGRIKGASILIGVDQKIYIVGDGRKVKEYASKPLATSVYDLDGNVVTYRLNKDTDRQEKSDKRINYANFYKAYQRKDGSYYIVQKGKVLYNDLKYLNILHEESNGTAIQIIDRNHRAKKIFLKADEFQRPMSHMPFMCGTGVMIHYISVVDRGKTLDVEAVFHQTDEEQYKKDVNKTHKVVRISKHQADRVFFKAYKNKITFENNYYNTYPMLYYQKGKYYGFLGNIVMKGTKKSLIYNLKKSNDKKLYDALVFEEDSKIRLQYRGLWGYHNLTKIKYKTIGEFDGSLARFELPNGKKGYVDLKGNEYYD